MEPKNLLADLIAAGWKQVDIAAAIGCSQPTVSELLNGVTGKRGPSMRIGMALVDLHKKVCGRHKSRV